MEKITLDQATLAKLHNLETALEICNENGEVVGFLTPAGDTKCPFSNQELDRRAAETQTYSTAEVLDHLEQL